MKIGLFQNGGVKSFGPVYDEVWIDLPKWLLGENKNIIVNTLEDFLLLDHDSVRRIDSWICEALKFKCGFGDCMHSLCESTYLPPVPSRPRLFAQRGNGSIFSRCIKLKMPCHPVFDLRYTHNFSGHNATFTIPKNYVSGGWNLELVAVVGKGGRNIEEKDVYKALAGYTMMIDHSVTVGDSPFLNEWKIPDDEMQLIDHFYKNNFNGNAYPVFPIGPWITTSDEIPDPHDLLGVERENDRLISKVHTGGFLFDFKQTISFISRMVALKPGDMIASASVGYDGYQHWDHYKSGSYIEVEMEKIGCLRMNIDDRREIWNV